MSNRIAVIESHVTEGHVGNRAAVPVLQLLQYHVLEIPTVEYTCRVGWPGFAGRETPASLMGELLAYLESRQPLPLVTGYLGGGYTVELVLDLARRWQDKLVVDPVMGDHPGGLYVSLEVAEKMKQLVPLADIVTPNRFEAEFITGTAIIDDASALAAAAQIGQMGPDTVVITSCHPSDAVWAKNVVWSQGKQAVVTTPLVKTDRTVYGAGDMFTALVAGLVCRGADVIDAIRAASGMVTRAIAHAWDKGLDTVDPVREMMELLPLLERLDDLSRKTKANVEVVE